MGTSHCLQERLLFLCDLTAGFHPEEHHSTPLQQTSEIKHEKKPHEFVLPSLRVVEQAQVPARY